MVHKIKIRNIKKENISYIENLCEENNCELFLEWQSQYNSYVVYDYEPLCTEGFEINAYIEGKSSSTIKFIEYLYNRRIEKINKLDAILNNEVKV